MEAWRQFLMDNMERLNTKKRLIAYIDILSGKKLIQEDNFDNNLNKVTEIYQCAKNIINTAIEGNLACSIDFKIFSDNILLTLTPEISDEKMIDISIYNFLSVLAFIQMKALERNILLRGGLTVGEICINETFAWGKGLLAAIELEEKYAIFPRIIIDNEAKKVINDVIVKDPGKIFYILPDVDGWLFIDYLSCWGNRNIDAIRKHLIFINEEIKKEQKNSSVMQKLLFQASYCNGYIMALESQKVNAPQIGGLSA